MIVDLVIPEGGLVTVSPPEVLGANVLVGVLGPLRAGVLVLLVGYVLPVGIPSHLCVNAGDDDAGDGDVERKLAPELARLASVLLDVSTLTVELVVLGTSKLLGALGAVVAAAGAGRSAGKGLARGGAGDRAGGEHGEGFGMAGLGWSGDGGWSQLVWA